MGAEFVKFPDQFERHEHPSELKQWRFAKEQYNPGKSAPQSGVIVNLQIIGKTAKYLNFSTGDDCFCFFSAQNLL